MMQMAIAPDVAILELAPLLVVGLRLGFSFCRLQAAAGVAECGDRRQRRLENGQRQILAACDACGFGPRCERQFADQHRERRVRPGANVHRLLAAVDGDRRTPRGVRDHGPRDRALRTEHDIGGLELGRLRMARDRR